MTATYTWLLNTYTHTNTHTHTHTHIHTHVCTGEYGNGCGADKVTVPECEGFELTKVNRMEQKMPCYTEDRDEL